MNMIQSLVLDLDRLEVNEPLSKKDLILKYYPYIDEYTTKSFNKMFYDARFRLPEKRFKSKNNIIIKRVEKL